jgi:hypothetical protein
MRGRLSPLGLAAATLTLPVAVMAAPIDGVQPMSTQMGCDPNVGVVSLGLDAWGAFGSATFRAVDGLYDPVDAPDRGPRGTVFESMPFLCHVQAGAASGHWLEEERLAGISPARTDGNANHLTSDFNVDGLDVHLEADLDCNILTQCYTFTNNSGARLDTVELTPYIDGDLYFAGNYTNDYGGTGAGQPRTLFEFDEGDDPLRPTTYLALFGDDPTDTYLQGWEIGEYSESRRRIGSVANGCEPLRGLIGDDTGASTDANNDLVTDSFYDVTLSLRFGVGPLEDGEMSPTVCYNLQWGVGLQCSDEDADQVCVIDDNCPAVANADQEDFDRDGVGDACDNCPAVANEDQANSDGDVQGDACDNCVQPVDEVCNGVDDDCDNLTDEDLGGAPCETGFPGVCATGTEVCNGADGIACTPDVPGSPELCDGLDNDCNGETDENVEGEDAPCVSDAPGICGMGATHCRVGVFVCDSVNMPTSEVCDGADNNCDGRIDEDTRNACGRCGDVPAELCNGLDDDCDGTVDDEAPCAVDQVCAAGRCADRCANFECGGVFVCVDGVCLLPCELTPCENGQVCNPNSGTCNDPCEDVSCPAGQVCAAGECVTDDCYNRGCPEGERCRDAACVADPCAETTCAAGEFCRDGACISSCAEVACASGESCVDGVCSADACAGVQCPDGQRCVDGECGADACAGIDCGPGRRCVDGACDDDPCLGLVCPPGEACTVVQGSAQCVLEGNVTPDPGEGDGGVGDAGPATGDGGAGDKDAGVIIADGTVAPPAPEKDAGPPAQESVPGEAASGCGCRQTGGGARDAAWMLLALPLGLLRRRRR